MKTLYIGGTGEISYACVQRSAAAGHEVTVFNRGRNTEALPETVRQLQGDMYDPAVYESLGREGFDVVCQFVVYGTDQVRRDLEVFGGRCGQYIFISSASCYQKPLRSAIVTEDVPVENPFWGYSRAKMECEELLRQEGEKAHLPFTIVRPSHTYRTRFPGGIAEGDHTAWRIRQGKPILVHGDGMSLWTYTHAEDFAVPFAGLHGNPQALGEAFHITRHLTAHTWDDILTAIGRALGREPKLVHVPTDTLVKYEPSWEEPLRGDKAWSCVFDNSKVMDVAGAFSCRVELEEGTRRVAERYLADPSRSSAFEPDPAKDALLDRIVREQSSLGAG